MSITKENLEERFEQQKEQLEKAEAQVANAENSLEESKAQRERIIGSLASLQELYNSVVNEENAEEQPGVKEVPPPKKTTKRGK